MIQDEFRRLVACLDQACRAEYGPRLVSLAIFGSVAREVARPDSDVDALIVADPLPRGRLARVAEFEAVERRLESELQRAALRGVHTHLAPVFKTPAEAVFGSPLLLDMTRDVLVLFDRDRFLARRLVALEARLRELGSKRVARAGGYYWVIKPDYVEGDVIEL